MSLPGLSSITVGHVLAECLRHRWSFPDQRISPLLGKYPLPLPPPRHALSLAGRTLFHPDLTSEPTTPGYGCFKGNKAPPHSQPRCYRGGWHLCCPLLASKRSGLRLCFARRLTKSGMTHGLRFSPAAFRRTAFSVSGMLWGLRLPPPLPIVG